MARQYHPPSSARASLFSGVGRMRRSMGSV